MEKIRLGKTNLMVSRTSFGAIPIQRVSTEESTDILRKAYANGVNFYDTARVYGTSEGRIGNALGDVRDNIIIASKTLAKNGKDLRKDLEDSLAELKTDYIDIYQFHNPPFVPRPGAWEGLYDEAITAKQEGKIRHIGASSHLLDVAREMVMSGFIDTMQYPMSSIASEDEIKLIELCKDYDVGFIAMKAMAGGLISNAKSAFVFLRQFDNVVPIWGIQFLWELDEFLKYESDPPKLDNELWDIIYKDRETLSGDFCRACGYCLPCPAEINIPMAARIEFLLGRMNLPGLVNDEFKEMMQNIKKCTGCHHCINNCPYKLDIPELLNRHLNVYEEFIVEYESENK